MPNHRPGLIAALSAVALLLLSSALLLVASLERWAIAAPAWSRTDRSVEDGDFDYLMPSPSWEPIGSAAQSAGAGMIALAGAIVLMAWAPGSRMPRSGALRLVGAVTAVPVALSGVHALLSGLIGSASPLGAATPWLFLTLTTSGLCALAAIGAGRSALWALAVGALLATTPLGIIAGSYLIAPVLAGYTSFDTTPWTETVSAVFPALSAVLLLLWIAPRRDGRISPSAARPRSDERRPVLPAGG